MRPSNLLGDVTHVASRGVNRKRMRVIKDLISISRNLKDRFDFIEKSRF